MSYIKDIFPDLADRILSLPSVYCDMNGETDFFVFRYHADAERQFTKLVSEAITESNDKLIAGDYDFSAYICFIDALDVLPSDLLSFSHDLEEICTDIPESSTEVSADFRDARLSPDRYISVCLCDHGGDQYISIDTTP